MRFVRFFAGFISVQRVDSTNRSGAASKVGIFFTLGLMQRHFSDTLSVWHDVAVFSELYDQLACPEKPALLKRCFSVVAELLVCIEKCTRVIQTDVTSHICFCSL